MNGYIQNRCRTAYPDLSCRDTSTLRTGSRQQVVCRIFHIEVGTVFRFMPEDLLRDHALRIQLDAFQNNFLELVIPCPVDQMSAVQIL